jgi:hypothetical protein
MTPLHFASFFGYSEVFKFLANHGDDLGAKTDNGLTALHLACHNGHLEVVKQFANFTKKEERAKEDSFGKYPIHNAAEKGFQEVVLFFFFSQKVFFFILQQLNLEIFFCLLDFSHTVKHLNLFFLF